MRISDNIAFLEHKKLLEVELLNGSGKAQFIIDINFPVEVYYKILCLIDRLNDNNDNLYRITTFAEIAATILKMGDRTVNAQWVVDNISPENLYDIIEQVLGSIDELLDSDSFKIPEINVKTEKQITPKSDGAKERQKKKQEINRLNQLLMGKRAVPLMDDIAIVMAKTSNSYFDIMRMPILIFRDVVKTIVINEQRTNDDYNLAYLKYECEKLKIELNSDKADGKPSPGKGADLKKLKALLNK